jgi:hypothetical protein
MWTTSENDSESMASRTAAFPEVDEGDQQIWALEGCSAIWQVVHGEIMTGQDRGMRQGSGRFPSED